MVKRPLRGGKADPLPTGAIDAERRVKVRGVHGLSASVAPGKQKVFKAYVRFARFLCLRLKHRSLFRDRHLAGGGEAIELKMMDVAEIDADDVANDKSLT